MRILRGCLAMLLVLGAAACAGRPHGVLIPTHYEPPGASIVKLMVATTRAPDETQPGEMFSGERGGALSFADITVSIPPDAYRKVGEVQWPESETPDPAREFTTVDAHILSREAALAEFNRRVAKTPKRQTLVFVHGFNTRFAEAVYRFAQISHDSTADVVPVLFTWPSRGKLLAYGYDHESASYSRDALESLLAALARNPNVGEISILAHSMGNWVTLEALRQMAIRDRGLPGKIKNVMLAAPDVDFDVFKRQIVAMGVRPSLFTIFVSRDDEALAVSKRVWGDKPRLGAVNPQAEPYRDVLDRDRIQVVDLTDVSSGGGDSLGHTKFAEAPAVVRSIGARLATGQTLSDGGAGVGEKLGMAAAGAASTVGAAAGVAVATPFAIVDPRTRENLSDHFDDVGNHAGHTFEHGASVLRP
ncbi:alpha/beta hydrolase [Methylocystis parvus]|uniref:Alpha/beta fold hydrolase n=1 Tax=Methylocystis parvus TaxID=134 RepID=A0A6B8LX80_9HYPH|nr:alpha/beta hydrolase [Methylocystis parvus]QGM97037.1 alpha/beta fold hydrolase [Methylocystis parvus]WBJ99068.1 alpha/beta hydrolase [Methylocystis parvus OBBP]